MKKDIKIFLGSSIVEFKELRNSLSSFIADLNSRFENKYDFVLNLFRCDDGSQNPYITKEGTQSDIDRNVVDSDICLFIFGERLGQYTMGEFDLAFKKFSDSGNKFPKIAVYFKKNSEATEDVIKFKNSLGNDTKYYYTEFDKDSIIKLSILVGLNIVLNKPFKLEVNEGNVFVDDTPIFLNVEDIPQFKNNQELIKYKEELKAVNVKYLDLKPLYIDEETRDSVEAEYINIASRREYLLKAIDDLQKSIFNLSSNLINTSMHGEVTPRMLKASKHLESGEYNKALVVLDLDDMESEYKLEDKADELRIKQRAENYINELYLRIDILNSMTSKVDRFNDINNTYKKIVEVIKKRGVKFSILEKYLSFLSCNNEKKENLFAYVEEMKIIVNFYKDNISKIDLAEIYSELAIFYTDQNNYNESFEYYIKSEKIYQELIDEGNYQFLKTLSIIYMNICSLYKFSDKETAIKYYEKAVLFAEKVYLLNKEKYIDFLIKNYIGIANLFELYNNNIEAEKHKLKAIDLLEKNKKSFKFLGALISIYSDLGHSYDQDGDYLTAETYFKKSFNICNKYLKEEPELYLEQFSDITLRLYNCYLSLDNPKLAENYLKKSIESREQINSNYPTLFTYKLAEVYNAAGNFYSLQKNYSKSENYFQKAKKIYDKLLENNLEANLLSAAQFYDDYALFNESIKNTDLAEQYFLKSVDLYYKLSEIEPGSNLDTLATEYFAVGEFYFHQNNIVLAEQYFLKSEEIFTGLFSKDKLVFINDLVELYNLYTRLYDSVGNSAKAELYISKSIELVEKLSSNNFSKYFSILFDVYYRTANYYRRLNKNDLAELYYSKIEEALARGEIESPASVPFKSFYFYMAVAFYFSSEKFDFKTSEEYYQQAIKAYNKLEKLDSKRYSDCSLDLYSNLSKFYNRIEKYDSAIEYAKKYLDISMKYYKSLGVIYLRDVCFAYLRCGEIYYSMNDIDCAKESFNKCLAYVEKLHKSNPKKYTGDCGHFYHTVGDYYFDYNHNLSEEFELKAICLFEESHKYGQTNNDRDLADAYLNCAIINSSKNNVDVFRKYLIKCIELLENILNGDIEYSVFILHQAYCLLGRSYAETHDENISLNYLDKAQDLANRACNANINKFNELLIDTNQSFAYFYKIKNEYSKSIEYYEKGISLFGNLVKDNPDLHVEELFDYYDSFFEFLCSINEFKYAEECIVKQEEMLQQYREIILPSASLEDLENNWYEDRAFVCKSALKYFLTINYDVDKFKFYFKKLVELIENKSNLNESIKNSDLIESYVANGCMYLKQRKYEEADSYISKALQLPVVNLSDDYITRCFSHIKNIYMPFVESIEKEDSDEHSVSFSEKLSKLINS